MEFKQIDKKWQDKWEKAKLFETDPSEKRKFFTSMVVPYVNGSPHIGHSYTYTRTDAYARFKRMQGFNTLLAQGWHATGEPILGTIERLKKGDKNQEETLLAFGATKKNLDDFIKKGPKYAAGFWTKKFEADFRSMGYSIDWRRTFTLSVTPQFSKFVEWQYNTLRKKGYVVQGTHPVVWCPKDMSPTGDHDRLKGEGESPAEYTILKFNFDDYVLPAATLRPETIYGVTNMWVNPEAEYVLAEVGEEKWIVSKEAAAKLKDQLKKIEKIESFEIKEIIGKSCREPIDGREISILPSSFVDPNAATGIVMSVPAHAPYDWIALLESKSDIEPINVVKVEGFGEFPAVELCEKMNITSLSQTDLLEEATSILYKKEFHTGTIATGDYAGTKVADSKDILIKDFTRKRIADSMWEVNDVVCRCTTKCHVKILENQWFLKYSDEEWKSRVRKCLSKMKIYPEEARNNFLGTIDWLKDKACARKSGLGTPLPWDREWIVETLSDSTIYMAFYTIAHIAMKIPSEKLTDEVFDFIFLGRGDAGKIAKESGIDLRLIKKMGREFEYFYPLDIRNSAKDLVQNHLTFFIFQHTAIFPETKWPKAISVNGYVNVEGEKMSKSKGNIIPLATLVDQHGADMVRINMASSGQGIDDADWREDAVRSYRNKYDTLIQMIHDTKKAKKTRVESIDLYLQSKMQRHIENTTKNFEKFMLRDVVQTSLFESLNDLKWYLRRVGDLKNANRNIMGEYVETIVKMVTPLTPHICEEMWHMLGNKDFVCIADWPKANPTRINMEAELGEDLLKKTLADIEEVKNIVKIQPKKITLFVAENWKFRVHNMVLKNKDRNMNDITKEIMATGAYGKATVMFIQNLYKHLNEMQQVMPRAMQFSLLNESKEFMEKEAGCKIAIEDSEKTENAKAKSATPQKFGIFME
jgi:leucyl-tRNA synthetase